MLISGNSAQSINTSKPVRSDFCQKFNNQSCLAFITLEYSVSGWLLFIANSAIFQLYRGENKLIFNEMMMGSVFCYTNTPSWIFIVLAHWNNCPRRDMSPHSNTSSRFRANQSLFFLLHAACLAEKQQTPILYSLVWLDQSSNPRSAALEASTPNHYSIDVVFMFDNKQIISQMIKTPVSLYF